MATTTGSIDARLTLDTDPFDRAADRAQARATELGALSPTVNVDANVGGALAGLSAVDAAEHRVGDSGQQMGQKGRTGILALVAAAPFAVAALGPIGGAAVGLGVAFGTMALAGVLAIKGIKDAMAAGSITGQQYTAGLGSMKGMLDQLSHTAAVGMLSGFNTVVHDLSTQMPFLNTLIYNSAGALGQMGGTALHGVLDGLKAMNPLITAGAGALNKFIGWLAAMPSSNGFTAFVSYSITNLPPVMTLIESLVTSVGRIIEAFAPLGPVAVGTLQVITNIINALPLPVLAGVVTTITSLGIALQIAGSPLVASGIAAVATRLAALGISANLAVPVVGILLAAIAGLTVGFMAAAASNGQATVALTDYGDALQRDNDLIGENVRKTAAKALQDSGAFDAALKLGIGQKELTDATIGQGAAWDSVKAKMGAAQAQIIADSTTQGAKAAELSSAVNLVTKAYGINHDQLGKAQADAVNMNAALNDQGAANNNLASALGMTNTQYQAAVSAQQSAKASTDANTQSMQLQNDAAGLLKNALDLLNGKTISAAQAQNSFDSSLVNMGDHVNATGKKITFTTTSIKDMSSASVALRGQLNSQVQNLQAVVEANGGLANSTGKARAQMVTMRQQIIDNAVAHGVDRAAVTAYIDKILAIPKKVPPTKLDVDNAAAIAGVQQLQAYINSLQGKTVWLTTHVDSIYSDTHVSNGVGGSGGQTRSEGGPIYRAGGGPIYLAGGGHSYGPIGTDTVAAWLTPGEHVMKRSSAESIGAPALKYMNDTGKLPNSGGGMVTVNFMLDGKIIDSRIVDLSTQTAGRVLDAAARDASYRRNGT